MQASRLSTLSLQHDKRMDDEARGGKRKLRVVQDQVSVFFFIITCLSFISDQVSILNRVLNLNVGDLISAYFQIPSSISSILKKKYYCIM